MVSCGGAFQLERSATFVATPVVGKECETIYRVYNFSGSYWLLVKVVLCSEPLTEFAFNRERVLPTDMGVDGSGFDGTATPKTNCDPHGGVDNDARPLHLISLNRVFS